MTTPNKHEPYVHLAGWAVSLLASVSGCVLVTSYVLDQVPVLSRKAEDAIRSLRGLRDTWKKEG
ncbi:hypothetical protein AB0M86_45820 [Streptomyces sp. NPDC051639]|uniref:hypothetical protein n=1 Tax=Streptomyces sp. NPDC051639 TaxID=3155671 RepID=UPI00342AE226